VNRKLVVFVPREALDAVRDRVSENGRPSADKMEAEQHAVQG